MPVTFERVVSKPNPMRQRRHLFRSDAEVETLPAPPALRRNSNEIYHLTSHAQSKSVNAVFNLRESLSNSSSGDRFIALPVVFRHFQNTPPPSSSTFDPSNPKQMKDVIFMTECLSCLAICLRDDSGQGSRRLHGGRMTLRLQANWKNGIRSWIQFLFRHFVEDSGASQPSSPTSSSSSSDDDTEEDFPEAVRNLLLFFGETVASTGIEDVLKSLPGFIDPYAIWWMSADISIPECLRIGKMRTNLGVPLSKLQGIQTEVDSANSSDSEIDPDELYLYD